MKKAGRKNDKSKLRWDLLPFAEIQEVVEVLTLGAAKYNDNNWMYVKNARARYFSAALRHTIAWWLGEIEDSEWGKHHLAHAICCLLFAMWLDRNAPPDCVVGTDRK